MGYYKAHIIQVETTIDTTGGVVDVVVSPGMAASYGGSSAAILYIKTTNDTGTATLDISVFNNVLGGLLKCGDAAQITQVSTKAYLIGINTDGTADNYQDYTSAPLSPHFTIRQTPGGASQSFDVTLAIAWLPSSLAAPG